MPMALMGQVKNMSQDLREDDRVKTRGRSVDEVGEKSSNRRQARVALAVNAIKLPF